MTLPTASTDAAADVNGTRSTDVDVEVGLTLTATFLQALGAPIPGADLSTTWKGARSLQFEVRNVHQRHIDIGVLGRALTGAATREANNAVPVLRRHAGDVRVRRGSVRHPARRSLPVRTEASQLTLGAPEPELRNRPVIDDGLLDLDVPAA